MAMDNALAGKVALVTGASRGIGLAISRRLGRMGARVSICGRDQAKLEQAAESFRGEGIETLATRPSRYVGPGGRPHHNAPLGGLSMVVSGFSPSRDGAFF